MSVKKIKAQVLMFIIVFVSVFLSLELIRYISGTSMERDKLIYKFDEDTKSYLINYDLNGNLKDKYLSYEVSYGIDVSEWQGVIDWNKVKNAGISFVMSRCGFREIVGSRVLEDDKFRENIGGASEVGLRVGVYFFGTAKNEEEAKEEAEFTYSLIKDYNITYPVAYDIETFDTGRVASTNYSTLSDSAVTFMEVLSNYGYETMVYSYKHALTNILDTGKFDDNLIWLAHFAKSTNYTGNYAMWQYSDAGVVDGIKGRVDLNISYFTYVDDVDDVIDNPNYVYPPLIEFKTVNDTVKTTRQIMMRKTPTTAYPNSLGYLPRDTVLNRNGISSNYSRIYYNGKMFYVENTSLTKFIAS